MTLFATRFASDGGTRNAGGSKTLARERVSNC